MARVMELPVVIENPEVIDDSGTTGDRWIVTVFNNEVNTWQEVIDVLMRATNCDYEEAEMETWEIDRMGRSTVHLASEEECREVAEVIATIGIRVEVSVS